MEVRPTPTAMLENYWYIACRARELADRPVPFALFDRPFVLFRDRHGRPGALEDRCAHRNAPLSAGKNCGGLLECPYHGWRYHTDGRAVDIPALPENTAISEQLRVKAYPCVEQDGYVWVCVGDRPTRDRPSSFPHLGDRGWTTFHLKTRFRAPVASCLENFLDCPHATFVHRFWFRAPTAKPVRAIVRSLEDGAVAEYFEEPRENSLVWSLLSQKRARLQHTDRFIAPATSRVDYIFSDRRHYIITSSCTPLSDRETEVYTVITFRFGAIGWLIRLFFEPMSRWIIYQDVKILNQQQQNIDRFGKTAYKLIPPDLLAPYIWKWRQAIATQTPPPSPGQEHHVEMRL
ncbi:aromatic ring-hydroxylating dioxygenase subunit alpha [Oxynema aestuarii]|nr:aromatic ring-hydroxylating dioxygenase subunit alpha [Oxynema aestuarii]